jgi:hypothetical protein
MICTYITCFDKFLKLSKKRKSAKLTSEFWEGKFCEVLRHDQQILTWQSFQLYYKSSFLTLFRISDILIRIRILGSVHWITDPESDPALFDGGFQMPTKNGVLKKDLFCLFLTVGTLASVLKDSMSLRSHKTVEIVVVLLFLLVDAWIRIQKTYLSY